MGRLKRDTDQPIRHHLRAWREAKGLTQQRLADASGLSRNVISEYESGKKGMSLTAQAQIARALGIAPLALNRMPDEPSLDELLADQPDDVRRQAHALVQAIISARDDDRSG